MDDKELQVRKIFDEAVALPPAEWPAFLSRRCDDAAVRARVQKLLDYHAQSENFLARPATEAFPGIAGSLGTQVGEFRIIREIGRGGMGVVYLAEDTVLKRAVALKVLPPQIEVAGAATDRFKKEAQAVARLSHPGIVQIYRSGEDRGYSFIAMEYVEGETLRAKLTTRTSPTSVTASRPRSPRDTKRDKSVEAGSDQELQPLSKAQIEECARITSEVADALEHAHRQGVIHRDVKPSNILVDRAHHARLTDFGVARITSERTLSGPGDFAGSYPYMSPEQARVRQIEIDHRTDIFSLGVVLYELLSGKRPFDGATPQEILKALSDSQPKPVRQLNRAIPVDLATICHKAIEKAPLDRYQTAAHLSADLRSYLSGQPILASPPSLQRRAMRWIRQHRFLVTTVAVGVLVLSVVLMSLLLKRASDAKHAWLHIETAIPCKLYLQPVDPTTLQLLPASSGRDISGSSIFGVAPAHYRVTVAKLPEDSNSAFAEADLLLLDLGPDHTTTVRILSKGDAWPHDDSICVRLLPPPKKPPENMARIAAGSYACGPGTGKSVLLQRQNVPLAAFCIDKHEVSNGEYMEFLRATAADNLVLDRLDKIVAGEDLEQENSSSGVDRHHHPHTPDFWKTHGWKWKRADGTLVENPRDLPVVGVRLRDGSAYARWKGKRLPTMFEWEAAARGNRPIPPNPEDDYSGDPKPVDLENLAIDCKFLLLDQSRYAMDRLQVYTSLAVSVSSALDPFETPTGVRHMYDNAREITSTIDIGNIDGIAKGRSWIDDRRNAPLSELWTFPLDERYFDRGFRCACSEAVIHH